MVVILNSLAKHLLYLKQFESATEVKTDSLTPPLDTGEPTLEYNNRKTKRDSWIIETGLQAQYILSLRW